MKPYRGAGFRLAVPRELTRQPDRDGSAIWEADDQRLIVSSAALDSPLEQPLRQALILDLMGREKTRYDQETDGRAEYRSTKNAQEGRDDAWLAGRDTQGQRRFVTALAVSQNTLVALRYECGAGVRDDDDLLRFLGSIVDSLRITT